MQTEVKSKQIKWAKGTIRVRTFIQHYVGNSIACYEYKVYRHGKLIESNRTDQLSFVLERVTYFTTGKKVDYQSYGQMSFTEIPLSNGLSGLEVFA